MGRPHSSAEEDCQQAQRIDDLDARTVRVHKELYEGREGRQPVIVRVDRCERIVNALTYVSTALLISVLIGAGAAVFRIVAKGA